MKTFGALLRLLQLFAVLGLALPAEAAPPAKRLDCALGYFDTRFDAALSIEPIDQLDTRLSARGGDGHSVGCSVQILNGLYAYGKVSEADAEFNLTSTFLGDTAADAFDLDVRFQRFGLGYVRAIGDTLSLYGQIGYAKADYDFEPIAIIFDLGDANYDSAYPTTESEGLDIESGVTWSPSSRLELGGFARFTENSSLTIIDDGGLAFAQKNDDDVRAGVRTKYRITEPVFVTADAEFGDVDTLFVGLGVRF